MIDTYKKLLTEFIRFKSVSTSSVFKDEIAKTATWLNDLFVKQGFKVQIITGYGNPIVVARYIVDDSLPTCLVYGHYDVQPAEIKDGWDSDPFELDERDERLYARGVVDNKGQVLIHIATVFNLIKSKKLGYNVVFMIEGDEETGSNCMLDFVTNHKKLLTADFALISDGEIGETPTIEVGFRGGVNITLTVRTAKTDLHSGLYGGIAPNAVHELSQLLAKLHDEHNMIAIPGFYDSVEPISDSLQTMYNTVPFDYNEYVQKTGARTAFIKKNLHPALQLGLLPTIQVSGIHAGYVGEGYRNGIPALATAKINIRITHTQDPNELVELFKCFIENQLPSYVVHTIRVDDRFRGIALDMHNIYANLIENVIEQVHNKKPLHTYCGASLPIVEIYTNTLNIPVIPVSLGNNDCAMHAPNENFDIQYIERGLAFSELFFSKGYLE